MEMTLFRPGGLALTKKGAEAIRLGAGDRVLDVGCGLGTSLLFLRDTYGIEPYGVDVQPAVVQKAAERLGEDRVRVGDACALPFDDNCMDALFLECVLTQTASPETALREAARVLKPGGGLVLSGLDGGDALCESGRMGKALLLHTLEQLGFTLLLCTDETASLRQFIAHAIFRYGGLREYVAQACRELGGCVLGCHVPSKGTGYLLVAAQR